MQKSIPFILMRGGTSRAACFHADDIPANPERRDRILLAIMGGPDTLQVDGLGGGHPLTSKVAIIRRSADDAADIDYLFLQIDPAKQVVTTTQNCGNILAAVGPFAIETGLVPATDGITLVRVRMLNSGDLAELSVVTPDGRAEYAGDTRIDGVPGSAAPVVCDFLDVAGSMTGALLPSGNGIDTFDGIDVTCIDNGMPVVLLRSRDVGLDGTETPPTLDSDDALKARLESIRLQAGEAMGLGNVSNKSIPKITLVSTPRAGGLISTQTFIPHVCHKSIGVLGAVSVASACVLPESVCAAIVTTTYATPLDAVIEHPSGSLTVRLVLQRHEDGRYDIVRSGVMRTARMIARGEVMVPAALWDIGTAQALDNERPICA